MVRFRLNVAAIMMRPDGRLLVCERLNFKGAWQFPQGGVDDGESLEKALAREVQEEVGISGQFYDIKKEIGGYRYLYPAEVREKKQKKHGFHGQEQTYYLCQLKSNAPEVNVNQRPQEFGAYRWIEPEEFDLDWLPKFKREVYRQVMIDFFGITL
jgi:putative (di)nucleoside polyphosphate hydrolase